MRMLLTGQMRRWQILPGLEGQVYLSERLRGIENHSLCQEFWKQLNDALEGAA